MKKFCNHLVALLIFSIGPVVAEEVYFDQPQQLDAEGFRQIFAQIGPRIYIAGQPAEEGLNKLKGLGVTTVVNLRTAMEMDNRDSVPFDESAVLQGLGVKYVHIPSGGPNTPYNEAMVNQFAQALEQSEGKVLLHCTIAWRASHMWAAYLVKHKGVEFSQAMQIIEQLNKGPMPLEGFLGETLTFSPVAAGSPPSPPILNPN